jgi:hypothetical protein
MEKVTTTNTLVELNIVPTNDVYGSEDVNVNTQISPLDDSISDDATIIVH